MRRFTRTPYYRGPDDPERGELRGTLRLGETVVIETVGGHDQDLKIEGELRPGAVMEVGTPRYSRPGGPFYIEGIEPGDWVSIESWIWNAAPTASTATAAPSGAACASSHPCATGSCTSHRTS